MCNNIYEIYCAEYLSVSINTYAYGHLTPLYYLIVTHKQNSQLIFPLC